MQNLDRDSFWLGFVNSAHWFIHGNSIGLSPQASRWDGPGAGSLPADGFLPAVAEAQKNGCGVP